MPDITVKGPDGPPVTYALDRDVVSVGRSPGSDLVVRDPAVSRLHLRLSRKQGAWVVTDQNSSHGTLVNGEAVDGARTLRAGDEITLGHTTLVFDAPVPGALREGDDFPTAPLIPWSGRGTGSGEGEPVLVGRSEPIRRVIETINAVAGSTATVLVTGESGTGKELVARLIHRCSPRSSRPFVVVNCPSLPDTLVEAELFGVERGVATGVEARRGKFEQAHEGTLFLDEVGDLDASAQAKLLRALSEKTIERVGGRGPVPVDVRVVAATNHDLRSEVERGAFRRDLYHRLNTVTVRLPPLRERREDVPLLVAHFVARGPGPRKTLSEAALEALSRHDFPGNVRELEHVIERAQLLARGPVVEAEDLPEEVAPAPGGDALGLTDRLLERLVREGESFWDVVATPFLRRELSREDVRRLITRAHAQAGGSYVEMARLLRIEGEYRRLLNFLHYHQLCVPR